MHKLNEYLTNITDEILALNDIQKRSAKINDAMNDLRIKYNQDSTEYPWDEICNWYTAIQSICGLSYIDTFVCLYPSILNIDEFVKKYHKENT